MFCKKGVLRNFAKLTGKHLCQSLIFNKVARPGTLLKKRLWHKCFLTNFAKVLRTHFFSRAPPVAASFLPWTRKVFEFFKWNARNQCIGWENYVYITALSRDWVLFRSSHRNVFCEKGVLTNFAKFTRKHLCESLFFNKVAGWYRQLY